jgi:hypothetical protein
MKYCQKLLKPNVATDMAAIVATDDDESPNIVMISWFLFHQKTSMAMTQKSDE